MSDQPALEFTGERFTPECVREIAYEHWHRYAWAAGLVRGRRVLDAACGEGYGSQLLARTARSVTGIDIDQATVEHARSRYGSERLGFDCGDCTRLPYDDDAFEVVVSFETLEHLEAQDDLLSEFRRVLRPDGFVLLSSPDRSIYSDERGYDNPFHVRELYRDELEALLARHFSAYRLWGQKLMFVSALWALDGHGPSQWLVDDNGVVAEAARPGWPPVYFLAVASAEERYLPAAPAQSMYGDRSESVYQHYNEEVARHIRAGHLLAEREAEIERLRARLKRPWWRRLLGP
ncbi:MAG: class I SAM-dependent methyltransferase [Pseudomonadota bacterium]|nr:MAG: class I SAM-dependent methyltransferase [Pseudomonadota bacterium]